MTTSTLTASSLQRTCVAFAIASLAASAPAIAQDLGMRPGPQEMPVAIVNGSVHTVSGAVIPKGFVLFDKGVITQIGSMDSAPVFIATTVQVDAAGKHVYPGLITPYSHLGLQEIQSVRASTDMNEAGDTTPEAWAAVSVNPDSTLIPVTRSNGVLVAGVFPVGGTIAGRASVMRMEGWTWEDMTVSRDAGLVMGWPNMRVITAWWMDQSEDEQRKQSALRLDRIREVFREARSYIAQKDAQKDAPNPATTVPTDVRYEAMRGVLRVSPLANPPSTDVAASSPCFIEAQDYDQIVSAVGFCLENSLRCIIVGGREAPLCAELLKKHDIPVIVNVVMSLPGRDDSPYDANYAIPAKLKQAGVRFCIASGEETAHERNLPYAAAMAAAHGLDLDTALRSVTLSAAEILGVEKTLGSLDNGKEATLIITDGNPLEVTTTVVGAYIQGKKIDLTNKQSVLAEKYRDKYKQQKNAPQKPAAAPDAQPR